MLRTAPEAQATGTEFDGAVRRGHPAIQVGSSEPAGRPGTRRLASRSSSRHPSRRVPVARSKGGPPRREARKQLRSHRRMREEISGTASRRGCRTGRRLGSRPDGERPSALPERCRRAPPGRFRPKPRSRPQRGSGHTVCAGRVPRSTAASAGMMRSVETAQSESREVEWRRLQGYSGLRRVGGDCGIKAASARAQGIHNAAP